jgi:plastocyanin
MKNCFATVSAGLVALALFFGGTGTARATDYVVMMTVEPGVGNTFDPVEITGIAGVDRIIFVGAIGFHTTTSSDGYWDSGIVAPGDSYVVDLADAGPGDYAFICTLHIDCCGMAGIIHVIPPCCPCCPGG